MLLARLNKYQEATRSFHRDLLTDNKKVIQAHNQVNDRAAHTYVEPASFFFLT